MTIYVFDSGALIDLFHHYYPESFPSLWNNFNAMIENGFIIATREVLNELNGYGDGLSGWCADNRGVFAVPTPQELAFVREIFNVPHFQSMIRKKERWMGRPVADPFVIARARCVLNGCVVTTEKNLPNASRIPNVCGHFGLDCTDLEGFMKRENWAF